MKKIINSVCLVLIMVLTLNGVINVMADEVEKPSFSITQNITNNDNNTTTINFILNDETSFKDEKANKDFNITEIIDTSNNISIESLTYNTDKRDEYHFLVKYTTSLNKEEIKTYQLDIKNNGLKISNDDNKNEKPQQHVGDISSAKEKETEAKINDSEEVNADVANNFDLSEWSSTDDGNVIKLNKYNGQKTELYIPGKYDGKKVMIGSDSLWNSANTGSNQLQKIKFDIVEGQKVEEFQQGSYNRLFHRQLALETVDVTGLSLGTMNNTEYMFAVLPKINNIIGLNTIDFSNVVNLRAMFWQCGSVNVSSLIVDLSNVNFPKVTTMSQMFDSSNLQSVNMSGINVPNMTNMGYMFQNAAIKNITFENSIIGSESERTRNIEVSYMFKKANVPLSGINMSNAKFYGVLDINYMFQEATNLQSGNMREFLSAFPDLIYMQGVFHSAQNIGNLDFSNTTLPNVTTMEDLIRNGSFEPNSTVNFDHLNAPKLNSMLGMMYGGKFDNLSFILTNAELSGAISSNFFEGTWGQGTGHYNSTYKVIDLSGSTFNIPNATWFLGNRNRFDVLPYYVEQVNLTNTKLPKVVSAASLFNNANVKNINMNNLMMPLVNDLSYAFSSMFSGRMDIQTTTPVTVNMNNITLPKAANLIAMCKNTNFNTINFSDSIFGDNIDVNMSYMFQNSTIAFNNINFNNLSVGGDVGKINGLKIFNNAKNVGDVDFTRLKSFSRNLDTLEYAFWGASDLGSFNAQGMDFEKLKSFYGFIGRDAHFQDKELTLNFSDINVPNLVTLRAFLDNASFYGNFLMRNVDFKNAVSSESFWATFSNHSKGTIGFKTLDLSGSKIYIDNGVTFFSSKNTGPYIEALLLPQAETIDLSNTEFPNMTATGDMFYRVLAKKVIFKGAKFPKLQNMDNMCSGLSQTINIDMSDVKTPIVNSMQYMFKGVGRDLEQNNPANDLVVDLSGVDVSNVTNMYGMFYRTNKLIQVLGTETWDVSNVRDFSYFRDTSNGINKITFWDFSNANTTRFNPSDTNMFLVQNTPQNTKDLLILSSDPNLLKLNGPTGDGTGSGSASVRFNRTFGGPKFLSNGGQFNYAINPGLGNSLTEHRLGKFVIEPAHAIITQEELNRLKPVNGDLLFGGWQEVDPISLEPVGDGRVITQLDLRTDYNKVYKAVWNTESYAIEGNNFTIDTNQAKTLNSSIVKNKGQVHVTCGDQNYDTQYLDRVVVNNEQLEKIKAGKPGLYPLELTLPNIGKPSTPATIQVSVFDQNTKTDNDDNKYQASIFLDSLNTINVNKNDLATFKQNIKTQLAINAWASDGTPLTDRVQITDLEAIVEAQHYTLTLSLEYKGKQVSKQVNVNVYDDTTITNTDPDKSKASIFLKADNSIVLKQGVAVENFKLDPATTVHAQAWTSNGDPLPVSSPLTGLLNKVGNYPVTFSASYGGARVDKVVHINVVDDSVAQDGNYFVQANNVTYTMPANESIGSDQLKDDAKINAWDALGSSLNSQIELENLAAVTSAKQIGSVVVKAKITGHDVPVKEFVVNIVDNDTLTINSETPTNESTKFIRANNFSLSDEEARALSEESANGEAHVDAWKLNGVESQPLSGVTVDASELATIKKGVSGSYQLTFKVESENLIKPVIVNVTNANTTVNGTLALEAQSIQINLSQVKTIKENEVIRLSSPKSWYTDSLESVVPSYSVVDLSPITNASSAGKVNVTIKVTDSKGQSAQHPIEVDIINDVNYSLEAHDFTIKLAAAKVLTNQQVKDQAQVVVYNVEHAPQPDKLKFVKADEGQLETIKTNGVGIYPLSINLYENSGFTQPIATQIIHVSVYDDNTTTNKPSNPEDATLFLAADKVYEV